MQTNRTIENPVKENEKEKCHVHATKSMLFNCTSETDQFRVKFEGYSSDSDFEKPKDKKVKDIPTAGKVMQDDGTQAQFQGDAVSCKQDSNKRTEPLEWEHLHPALQALLPFENGLTYVITDFTLLPSEDFLGAPEHSYEATVRINIAEKESAQSWMQKMMQHSKCTYRHTRGRKTGLKRVLYKVEMHCQHQRKKPTPRQLQKSSAAKSRNARKVLTHDTRAKKTECPSKINLTVLVPTKRPGSSRTKELPCNPSYCPPSYFQSQSSN